MAQLGKDVGFLLAKNPTRNYYRMFLPVGLLFKTWRLEAVDHMTPRNARMTLLPIHDYVKILS